MGDLFDLYIKYSIGLILVIIVFVVLYNFISKKEFKINGFKFSIKNFYILLSPLWLSVILVCLKLKSWGPMVIFIVMGIAGVVGEILFSIWWKIFYYKNFWEYKVKTVYKGYSSYLNFICWSIGAFIELYFMDKIILFFNIKLSLNNMIVYFIIFAITLFVLVLFKKRINPNRKVTIKNYTIFILPIIIPFIFIENGLRYASFFIIAGIVAFLTEYLLGKASEFFITKKLWVYNYKTIDKKHTTLLNIIPFSLSAAYLLTLFILTSKLLEICI